MASSVAHLPGNSAGDGLPPAELYKIAVEEYRFQAQFNWSRTQYLLALNVGVLVAGSAIAAQLGKIAVLAFGLGLVAAVLTGLVVHRQHDYYRAARRHMQHMEDVLGLPAGQRIETTSTLGGRSRLVSVNQLVYVLLGALAVADLIGLGLTLAD